MPIPLLIVGALMVLTFVGARAAELAIARVTLVPGLQSVAVRAGQSVEVRLSAGASWRGGGVLSGITYAAIAPASGAAPVVFPAPPAVASFVASWTPAGSPAEAGSVLLLVPPGQTGSSTVTDPASVTFATGALAALGQKNVVSGLTFGQSGSAQTFSQGLQAFQTYANGPAVLGPSGVQIRSDGVLDYATLSLLASAASGLF